MHHTRTRRPAGATLLALLAAACLALALAACSSEPPSDTQLRRRLDGLGATDTVPAGDPRRSPAVVAVATTHPVLGDLARVVGGTNVRVTDVLRAGLDPHAYRPVEADVATVGRAQLVLRVDRGIDPWLPDLLARSSTSAKVVDAAAQVPQRTLAGGVPDPYVWNDPANGVLLVRAVTDALVAADPADEAPFRAAAARLIERIEAAGAEVDRILAPARGRPVVTAKATVGWMAARVGLEVVGTVVPGPDARVDVTTAHLTSLRETIEQRGVRAVFGESTLPVGEAEGLAKDARISFIGGGDALLGDTLGLAGGGNDTYVAALVHNARELAAHA